MSGHVLVVGSGLSGTQAAAAALEGGARVTLIDPGVEDRRYDGLVPDRPFDEVRRSDADQERFFLGLEPAPSIDDDPAAPQLTPPRRFVLDPAGERAARRENGFRALESVAVGGLGATWGASCSAFRADELAGTDIPFDELRPHFGRVARRIGVTGGADTLSPAFGSDENLLPPIEIDANARRLLSAYERRGGRLAAAGFRLGRPHLAVLTRPLGDRPATRYHDMDFWSNTDRSVYRPRWTIEAMTANERFRYVPGLVVERFEERSASGVTVTARARNGGRTERISGDAVVLAAGVFGTARIVLRSLNAYDVPRPLVCNPHVYLNALIPARLGASGGDRRQSLAQLAYDVAADGVAPRFGHVFSYHALLYFKRIAESPLGVRAGIRMLPRAVPAMSIILVQHPDAPSDQKTCCLIREKGDDILDIRYARAAGEERADRAAEKRIGRFFRSIGAWTVQTLRRPAGASIHYGGPFPTMKDGGSFTCEPSGRLRGTRAVYIADGSAFGRLPSKSLTFTMMANADRIGAGLAQSLA